MRFRVHRPQVASLDDVKTSVHIDTNAAKAIALDHLGVIAARLRLSTVKARQRSDKHPLVPLDEVCISYRGGNRLMIP